MDTATARRQQRVEDATRVGLQFPCRPERRGRGAPSVAMKWGDAVKSAIMHGPLPPEVTFDVPYWWQLGMPLSRPVNHIAPVPVKRKRDKPAEPKTDRAKRAYVRAPDEAKLWFVDFHAYHARVQARHTLAAFAWRSSWCRSSSGPWHPTRSTGMTALPPLALSRLANLSRAVAARLSLSVHSWQHVYRRVLRELDIEFEPGSRWTGVRLTLPENANTCSCASSTCAIASESHRIAYGTWTRQLCAWFQQASVGGARRANQPMCSLRARSSRSHLLQT